VIVEFNGSGGYGDPILREPERVAADVRDGKVSRAAAARHYGVVLGDDLAPDPTASAARREEIRAERRVGSGAGAALGPVPDSAIVLRGAAGSVDVALHDGQHVWCCAHCAENLGPAGENFKLRAIRREDPPPSVDAHMYPDPTEFSKTQLLVRRYACPACATLLAHEFCLADDEPWHDFRIELGGVGA
jgi:N-methylhydantoinase B